MLTVGGFFGATVFLVGAPSAAGSFFVTLIFVGIALMVGGGVAAMFTSTPSDLSSSGRYMAIMRDEPPDEE